MGTKWFHQQCFQWQMRVLLISVMWVVRSLWAALLVYPLLLLEKQLLLPTLNEKSYTSLSEFIRAQFVKNTRYGFWKTLWCIAFYLAVERLTVTTIQSAQSSMLKFIKSWLNPPRNCTPWYCFSSRCTKSSFLPYLKVSAKLSYILAVEQSVDPLIVGLRHSIVANSLDVFPTIFEFVLAATKASVTNTTSTTFKKLTCDHLHSILTLSIGIQALSH